MSQTPKEYPSEGARIQRWVEKDRAKFAARKAAPLSSAPPKVPTQPITLQLKPNR